MVSASNKESETLVLLFEVDRDARLNVDSVTLELVKQLAITSAIGFKFDKLSACLDQNSEKSVLDSDSC